MYVCVCLHEINSPAAANGPIPILELELHIIVTYNLVSIPTPWAAGEYYYMTRFFFWSTKEILVPWYGRNPCLIKIHVCNLSQGIECDLTLILKVLDRIRVCIQTQVSSVNQFTGGDLGVTSSIKCQQGSSF